MQSRVKEVRQEGGKQALFMQALENLAGLCATGSTDAKLQPTPQLLEIFQQFYSSSEKCCDVTLFLFLKYLLKSFVK